MYAGLIHLALPKAKIVWIERDPMDACYALFKTLFPDAYPYTYDLEELTNYIVAYRQLVEHWNLVIPNVIHRVRYEDLIEDSKPVIEDMLEYCDLSFAEDSVNFRSAIEEARSVTNVRAGRELHSESIGEWKNYSEQLQPAADIFRQAGIHEEHG